MKKAIGTFLLYFVAAHLFAQVPYESWFQGIIYGSNGRVYADGSSIVTGQVYPSNTFLVRTDDIGTPVSTRYPSLTGRLTQLQGSLFTPTGEALLFNTNSSSTTFARSALLSKWNIALDTVWAYSYRATAFHLTEPDRYVFNGADDGYTMGFILSDTMAPYLQGRALAFVDTAGTVQWAVEYPVTLVISHVIRANDGGYLFTGTEGTHHLCFKTDAAFAVQWCTELTAAFEMRNARVVQGTDDVVHYFVGIRDTVEVINFGSATYSRSMAWLDLDPSTGALLNTREVDFRWPTLPSHLMRTSDGNFLAGGRYTNNSRIGGTLRRWEAYVMKLTPSGDVLWADTLAMGGYRNSVISMDEHHDRLFLYTERYDHINPFHQYFVLDTEGSPICGLARTDFHPLGPLAILLTPYASPAFTPAGVSRTPIAWTIGNSAMPSVHLCGGLTTGMDETDVQPLSLFPNPTGDRLHLGPSNTIVRGKLTITDLHGRIVLRAPDAPTVDVVDLLPGIYLLTRTTATESRHARFVKE